MDLINNLVLNYTKLSMLGGEYTSRYEQIEIIGRSIQDDSQMYLVKDTLKGEYRTAKKLCLEKSTTDDENQLLNEVSVLKELNHPHIIHYYDIYLQGDFLRMYQNYYQEGDLSNYIQKKKAKKQVFAQKLLLSWIMQLLMGLEYIHNKHIVHRLVESKNIYLNHQGDLKIGSFGSAKMLENTLKKAVTVVTAPCNMSPEMVKGETYNTKADIWALGCLIYQMTSLKPLYTYTNLPQLYDLIVQTPSPDLPIAYGRYLNPIYRKMMKKNPSQRMSASELLQEEVFVSLMKQYIKKKKIDSLDLKYLVPKKLTIHKTKEKKKEKIKLPPISPNLTNNTKPTNLTAGRGNAFHSKTQNNSESRVLSRQNKKKAINSGQSTKMEQSQETPQRLTKIDQNEGHHISHLCEIKLNQIMVKYKPNLSEIYEKTFQFQDLQ